MTVRRWANVLTGAERPETSGSLGSACMEGRPVAETNRYFGRCMAMPYLLGIKVDVHATPRSHICPRGYRTPSASLSSPWQERLSVDYGKKSLWAQCLLSSSKVVV